MGLSPRRTTSLNTTAAGLRDGAVLPVLPRGVLISDTARFDDVKVIGVDDHVWRHTRKGDKYVT